ncbi:MAG: thioredoxin, partial [Actinomycetota bacterium]
REDDESPWPTLAESRGVEAGTSALTLFAGQGPTGVVDQLSREPESLARSLALQLLGVLHPKMVLGMDAMVVVSPEHGRIFREAGWSREHLTERLLELTTRPADELVRGAQDIAEGMPEAFAGVDLPKFGPEGLLLAYAGGGAGLFSAIIGGWVNGTAGGSTPITVEVGT